uniref:ATP-binding cassette domain-containing protein n=1 Tax=Candidatus Fimivicinus sp. TaxID=3056640 RepID=UPI003FED499C
MLEIKNLRFGFGRKTILKGITYSFESGVYGLLGPNGAGKTTLMRCMTGLYAVPRQSICYNGNPILNGKKPAFQIGYLPQKFGMYKDLTLMQMLHLIADMKGINSTDAEQQVQSVLDIVNLSDRANSRVKELSGGMVRRAGIAQALLGNPDMILFDEPTAGLDPEERLRFQNIISEIKAHKTIIISTHIVEDVEAVCDYAAVMQDGNIVFSGSRQETAELAKGKIYEVPLQKLDALKEPYYKQKQYERDGVQNYRILSPEPQDFPCIDPRVEDGYICV